MIGVIVASAARSDTLGRPKKSIMNLDQACVDIEHHGFATLVNVFSEIEVQRLIHEIESTLVANLDGTESLRGGKSLIGGRNLLAQVPICRTAWKKAPLIAILQRILGDDCGLVRGLYFDKPPEKSWSLPWHKDMTIAVRQHHPSAVFQKPTVKAGVPHVEASESVLQKMLTLRCHLDSMNLDNGPVQVIAGSHRSKVCSASDERSTGQQTIQLSAGDVFIMRPLLTHCSIASAPGNTMHRRILHLEFAASRSLPDRFEWFDFTPL
jgi:Phytanoyl-CoA dioxygenase (PhyH)